MAANHACLRVSVSMARAFQRNQGHCPPTQLESKISPPCGSARPLLLTHTPSTAFPGRFEAMLWPRPPRGWHWVPLETRHPLPGITSHLVPSPALPCTLAVDSSAQWAWGRFVTATAKFSPSAARSLPTPSLPSSLSLSMSISTSPSLCLSCLSISLFLFLSPFLLLPPSLCLFPIHCHQVSFPQ